MEWISRLFPALGRNMILSNLGFPLGFRFRVLEFEFRVARHVEARSIAL